MPELGDDAFALVREADQFRSALDRNAHRRQPINQQPFVCQSASNFAPPIGVEN
jgi:hypothetical protein